MWTVRQILLALTGLIAGGSVAAGLSAFVSSLGVVSDFADRTHTGERIHFYEDCLMLGGILGNLFWVYQVRIPGGAWLLPLFGLFGGVFVGAWSMALAEILDIFPVYTRRLKLGKLLSVMILGIALGKTAGAVFFFFRGW